MNRIIFFVSDSTGITAETLGSALLTQFQDDQFDTHTLRYVNTEDKARSAAETIRRVGKDYGTAPIIFSTLIDRELREIVSECGGVFLDFFGSFIEPLENAIGQRASPTIGRSHSMETEVHYSDRMDAVNFALTNDDGVSTRQYGRAEIVLVGVSRTGKTPTCLYLALHYGIYAANYPLTEEDLNLARLPEPLHPHRSKLFGLTIDPHRLSEIRGGRRPDSRYASLQQCRFEVAQAETIFQTCHVPRLNSTAMSVEEIATSLMNRLGLKRHT
ncbi:MAG: kinase/pyrophosphorylase [Pseudomonadota bacterium]|nr:MAG: kinase/pyrophosphorylase [Pseudomonadota bacterium]